MRHKSERWNTVTGRTCVQYFGCVILVAMIKADDSRFEATYLVILISGVDSWVILKVWYPII